MIKTAFLSPRRAALLIGAVSALLLAGAFAFQYIGGLPPCPLCLLQRWTHVALIAICALVALRPSRPALMLGLLASLAAVALAVFHVGVEAKWWEGLASCSGAAEMMSTMSGADLLSTAAPAPIIKCSDVAWSLFGISMAGWNALITALAGCGWGLAWRKS